MVKPYRGGSGTMLHVADDASDFARYLMTLPSEGLEAIVRKASKPKSRQLEKAWWAIIVPIAQECLGIASPYAAHCELLHHIGDRKEGGEVFRTSDSDFSTSEQLEYYKRAQVFLAEQFGAYAPDPNEVAA